MTGMHTLSEVTGELDDVIVANLDSAPGSEEHADQERILFGNGAPELGDDTRGHTQLQADGIDVAAARPTPGGHEHLVFQFVGNDLLDDTR